MDKPVLVLSPQPEGARKYGRLPLFLVAGALVLVLLLMLGGMGLFKGNAPEQETEPAPPPEIRETPLVQGGVGSGLVMPEPEAPPLPMEAPEDVNFEVVVPPAPKPSMEQQLWEEYRRNQIEAGRTALQAPLGAFRVGTSGSSPGDTGNAASSPSDRELSTVEQQEGFLARSAQDSWQSPYRREAVKALSLMTGTVLPAVMIGSINSDLPGPMLAQVGQNVFDSATGRHLLIPQGSRLYGVYDARVAMGQRRVLVAWNRIVFPDGSSVTLGAEPGADSGGSAGFEDKVNNHYLRIFGSSILMSLIGGGMAYTQDTLSNTSGTNGESETTMQNAMTSALAAQLGQATLTLLQQNAAIKPTLEIRPGFRFNVVLTKDLSFEAPYTPQKAGGR